jgi:predicted PurR-regulated permease PerM
MTTNDQTTSNGGATRPIRQTALATVVVLMVLLGFALLLILRNVLVSVFLGLLLATALRPVMQLLRKARLPSFVAAAVSLLLLLGALGGFAAVVTPLVTAQIGAIQEAVPELYGQTRDWLVSSDLRLFRQIGYRLDLTPPDPAAELPADDLAAESLINLAQVGYVGFVAICTFVFTYYWLLYRERSIRGMLLLLPMERRAGIEQLWLQIEDRIGAFLRGQLILGAIVAACSLVGYWIAGVPYAFLLALVAGMLELVPFVGPFIAVGVAMAVSLSVSTEAAVGALIVGLIVQQIENNLLAPRITEKAVGISPVVTLLAFVGFAALFGPAGALLAIPLAATLQVLFQAWVEGRTRPEEVAPEGRTMADRLRYSARDMAADIAAQLRAKEDSALAEADAPEEELERIMLDLDTILADESEERRAPGAPLALEAS